MQQLSDDRILEIILEEGKVEQGFRALMDKYQERIYWHIRRMLIDIWYTFASAWTGD